MWKGFKVWLNRRRVESFALGTIGWLGASVVIAGVLIAWRSDNATPVPIAGASLVAAWVVARYFEELQVSYKDVEATARRSLRDVEEQVDKVAASTDLPAELRDELDGIKKTLRSVEKNLAESAPKTRPRPKETRFASYPIGTSSGRYLATAAPADSGFLLSISPIGSLTLDATTLSCTVTAPDGRNYFVVTPGGSYRSLQFPRDFPGAPQPPIPSGVYSWLWETEVNPNLRIVVASGTHVVA